MVLLLSIQGLGVLPLVIEPFLPMHLDYRTDCLVTSKIVLSNSSRNSWEPPFQKCLPAVVLSLSAVEHLLCIWRKDMYKFVCLIDWLIDWLTDWLIDWYTKVESCYKCSICSVYSLYTGICVEGLKYDYSFTHGQIQILEYSNYFLMVFVARGLKPR